MNSNYLRIAARVELSQYEIHIERVQIERQSILFID